MKLKKLSFFFFAITAFVLLIAATSLSVSAEEVTYPVEGGNIYFETETGAIVGCDPTITRADIPEYIDGVKVTSIASLAFTQSGTFDSYGTYGVIGTPSLKYVSIPDTVTGIGAYAFCKSSIESIVIPKSVTKLSHDFNYFISSFNGGPKTLYYRGTKSDFQRLLNGYAISQPVVFDYTCEAPYGHSFDTWNITVAQTCTEEGEEHSVCSYCQSETKTRAIPVHSWDNILTTVEPTCTKKGQQLKTCTVCNATETQSIPSAGGHKWNEWTVTVEPTSDTDGKKFRTCTVCGASDSRIIFTNGNIGYSVEGGYIYFNPKTGAIVGCDPTITRADIPPYIDGIKVVGIGKFAFLQSVFPIETTPSLRYISLPDTITYLGMCPFYGTSIESIVLPESLRSLTEAPYPNELCTLGSLAGGPDIAYYRGTREKWRVSVESIGYGNCPIVYDYKCEGLYGHEYNDWTAVTLPTCTEKGEDIRTCSLCGESETRTVSARHTWSDVVTVVKPSCTTAGSGVRSCVNCDVSQTVVIPIEHSFGEWQVIQDYGCIEGIKLRTCTICKTKEEEMLPATEDHSWSDWKEDTAATCTVEGKESHYCLNCNYTESRTVPTNDNHSWSDWNVTIAPTAESEGKEVRLCTVCGATETRTVSITGEIAYPVEGGNLYFDPETGTITGASQYVTVIDIPAEINGVEVTQIKAWAFEREKYIDATQINIPSTVKVIGEGAFYGISTLQAINVDPANTYYCDIDGVLFSGDRSTLISYPNAKPVTEYAVPEGVTTLAKYAFVNTKSLDVLDLRSITTVKNRSLAGIYVGSLIVNSDLESIESGSVVTDLDLDLVTDINKVYCTGDTAGKWAYQLGKFCNKFAYNYNGILDVKYPVEGGNIYFDPVTGTITSADYGVRDLNIPAEINGIKVTAIADRAFAMYTDEVHGVKVEHSFRSVTFPDTLTSIGNSAFYGVESLKSVTIPGTVKTIGVEAFRNCCDLEEVVVDVGVELIGDYAFYQCYELKSATVGATEIDDNAFSSNSRLDSLTLLEGVEIIGYYAFADISITELTIPSSVRTIDNGAFEMCDELVSLTLNEGLETIGAYAFADTEIEWVDIPLSVVSIGENAFAYTPFEDALNSCIEHNWGSWTVSTKPTCIKAGTEQRTCSVCLAVQTQSIPATGEHSWGNWITVVNPTCINNGTQKRSCATCTATEPAVLPATGVHSWGNPNVTIAPTCTSEGERQQSCLYCSETVTETIPATGEHIFGDWTVTVEPTAFAAGERSRKCENCDHTETEILPELEMANPFTDVKDGKWYTEGILYCYHNDYMTGMTSDIFGYKESVTRAMFVTILAKIDGADTSSYTETSFSDVKAGQWYSASIEWAYQNGYAAGIGDKIFGYKENVSREQLAMFLYTYSQKNGVDVSRREDISGFADVDRIHGYALDAVKWAVHANLISGTSDTTLSPRDPATRAEISLIVMNYVENVKG